MSLRCSRDKGGLTTTPRINVQPPRGKGVILSIELRDFEGIVNAHTILPSHIVLYARASSTVTKVHGLKRWTGRDEAVLVALPQANEHSTATTY